MFIRRSVKAYVNSINGRRRLDVWSSGFAHVRSGYSPGKPLQARAGLIADPFKVKRSNAKPLQLQSKGRLHLFRLMIVLASPTGFEPKPGKKGDK
jgi:hypothetical protein